MHPTFLALSMYGHPTRQIAEHVKEAERCSSHFHTSAPTSFRLENNGVLRENRNPLFVWGKRRNTIQ